MLPAAGWYRSPNTPEILRYWDGEIWTENTRRVGYVARPTSKVEAAKIVQAQISSDEMIEAGFSTRVLRASFYVATTKRVIVIKPRGLREHDIYSIGYDTVEAIKGDQAGYMELKTKDHSFDDFSVHGAPVNTFASYVRNRISEPDNVDVSVLPPPAAMDHLVGDGTAVFAPRVAETPVPDDASPADVSLASELHKLAELHIDGKLTDDEFSAAKTKLLED